MSKDIKIGDKVKLKCYRGEKEFTIYTVVALPYVEEKSGCTMVKATTPDCPGTFSFGIEYIVEVISEEV